MYLNVKLSLFHLYLYNYCISHGINCNFMRKGDLLHGRGCKFTVEYSEISTLSIHIHLKCIFLLIRTAFFLLKLLSNLFD